MVSKQELKDSVNSEAVLVPLLASRSFHLPGNTWKEDWIQWFRNNHILFGICLHHRLHPLEGWERCLLLAASVSFGFVATNLHMIYAYHTLLSVPYEDQELVSYQDYIVTPGMLMLWTVGGLSHSIFDMVTWHIMACACCHPGGRWGDENYSKRYKDCGSYALVPLILALLACAVFLALLRATSEGELDNEEAADAEDDTTSPFYTIAIKDCRSFAFLSKYTLELVLAWFVCFPIVGTIVFSGILGCGGRLPVLGGRPRDMKLVEEGFINGSQRSHYARF